MRCVIADPSASMRRILRNTLHRFGCEDILDFADGKQALEACDPATSLLITSWSVEGIDGVELARRIRANPETADIPILMVTDHNAKDDVIEAREAGISEYMLKPFLGEQLRAKIECMIRTATSPNEDTTSVQGDRFSSVSATPDGQEINGLPVGAPAEPATESTPELDADTSAEEERKAA